jgi:hypothetical protein
MRKLFFITIVFSGACIDKYNPPVISTNRSYLVVEGFINNGPDSTVFALSHTYPVSDSASPIPELGAKVTVQGSDNSAYTLGEMGSGNYGAALSLNTAMQYRLDIITSAGKEYRSDYVPLKTSPPIDSINWANTPAGLQLYANTHDPQHASTYYRWDYSETWEFTAVYNAMYQYDGQSNMILPLPVDTVYTCWKSDQSTNILLASTANLSQDRVYEAPLVLIPPNSWEISVEYSILVKQYVLTPDAYNFWLNLQKNTELTGTIFSPQPSAIPGNIHSLSDSTEQVIGYISGGTFREQRIYITAGQIPNWRHEYYTSSCYTQAITDYSDTLLFYLSGNSSLVPIALDPNAMPVPPLLVYYITDRYCVDCTLIGTNHKPSFWP